MKKFFSLFLALFVLFVVAGVVSAQTVDISGVSVSRIRGLQYLSAQSANVASTETTVMTVSNVGPYISRSFQVVNPSGAQTCHASVEASVDGSNWTVQEAAALLNISAGASKSTTIAGNPMPYWRVRAVGGMPTAEVTANTAMSTN